MKVTKNLFDAVKISDGSFVAFGHEVINLATVRAVVIGRVDHSDGSVGLVLREIRANGKLARGQWEADPAKCRK